MYEIKQIRIQKQDKYCFLVPKFEKEIKRKVTQIKQKNDFKIKIGCFIQYFSLWFLQYLSDSCFKILDDERLIYSISKTVISIFACLICGLFIDIISIQYTWRFTIISNVFFSFIFLLSALNNNNIQVLLFAKISFYFLIPICLVNTTCVLTEATTDYRDRLNNIVMLEVFGDYFPLIFTNSINLILNLFFNLRYIEVLQIYKYIIPIGVMLNLLLNLISFVILNKTYKQIQKIKCQSIKYQRFLIHQGFGLSISKITKYMFDKNIYYLLVIAALGGCLNTSLYKFQFANSLQFNSFLSIVINTFGMIASVIIMRFVNSRKILVQSTYKTVSYCLYVFLISCTLSFIIYLDTHQISERIFFFINTIILTVYEVLYLVLYCIIHQIVIILLPNRITMRAISYSITLFPYFLFKGFFVMGREDVFWQRLFKIFIVITAVIVNFFYQRRISFDAIEQKLIKQHYQK